MKIDDEKLMAFADGELEGLEREAVKRALDANPRLRETLAQQQRLRSALTGHYGPVAAEPVPERLLTTLGAAKADDGISSLADARARRRTSRESRWRNFGAIAATLVVGLLAGQLIPSRESSPVGVEGGALVAQGDLAATLETQLASAQAPNAAYRIGVTFVDREGRACRTFDASAASGIACRVEEHWALVMMATTHPRQTTEYRQAGSVPVLEAAQEMMSGEPLDAAAEQEAMRSGWRISRAGVD